MSPRRLAVYGDNCIDRYVGPGAADFVGGNAVNVAVHLAAEGIRVSYFGVTGSDTEGRRVRKSLEDRGVDCARVRVRDGATAVTWIEVRDGERIVLDDRAGVQCPLSLDSEDLEALATYDMIHCPAFTGWNIEWREAQPKLLEEVKFLSQRGCFVSIDFSELWEPEIAKMLGACISVAFVSRGQLASKEDIDQTIAFFHRCGAPEVVVTLGGSGSVYSGAEVVRMPALPIAPVDTLGAGDAFIAGWLFSRLSGDDVRGQLRRATRTAADACLYLGAWPQIVAGNRTLEKGSI